MTKTGFFDTHCHIDLTIARGVTLEEIQNNLKTNNITKVIQIASDPESVRFSPDFCREQSGDIQYYYTIGLHPNEAHELDVEFCLNQIQERKSDERFVAVGEVGLDFYYGLEHKIIQIETFEKYLDAAVRIGKPVVVHTRSAHEDTIALVKKSGIKKVLIHCFTGNKSQMFDFLDIGAYISFSGIVTFKNAVEVRESALFCPVDRMVIETDSPYLAPVPHRGKVNLPGYVRNVGEFISDLHGKDLTNNFMENSMNFFFPNK